MAKVVTMITNATGGQIADGIAVFEKLVEHPLIRPLVEGAQFHGEGVDTHIVDRAAEAIERLKKRCGTHERMAYEALLVALAPDPEYQLKQFAKRLGVRRHTLKARQAQREKIDECTLLNIADVGLAWFTTDREIRKDAFIVAHKQKYEALLEWLKGATVSQRVPHKTVTKHAGGRAFCRGECKDDCEKMDRFDLLHTLEETYELLKMHKPEIASVLSFSRFTLLRPWWLKDATTSTCVCPYHLAQHRMRVQFQRALLQLHKKSDCDCDCGFCKEGDCCEPPCTSTANMILECIPCDRGGLPFNKTVCIERTCAHCAPPVAMDVDDEADAAAAAAAPADPEEITNFLKSPVFNCPKVQNSSTAEGDTVNWHEWKEDELEEEYDDANGVVKTRIIKRMLKVPRTTSWKVFTAKTEETLLGFLEHNHSATCAAYAFDEMIDNLDDGEVIMLLDYGMNYSHVHGSEVQADFWTHHQTTVLPIIVYRKPILVRFSLPPLVCAVRIRATPLWCRCPSPSPN